MNYLAVLIVVVVAVEIFSRLSLKNKISEFYGLSQKSLSVMSSSRISDHWKERALPIYAKLVLWMTLKIFGFLLLGFSIVFFLILLIQIALDPKHAFLQYIVTWEAILLSTVFCLFYCYVKSYCAKKKL